MVTVLSLASARSCSNAFSVKGQIRFQKIVASQAAIQTTSAAMTRAIVLPRGKFGDDLCVVLPGPVGEAVALVRVREDINLGVRNACEVLATLLQHVSAAADLSYSTLVSFR